ncbi:MAG: type IX secretion system membrane protein PorP/SprF [Bacteroidetes bacterium]|nr:MAG: type IX secretion system membrane protein PorP/SprF [Bacteroidota bacterium]
MKRFILIVILGLMYSSTIAQQIPMYGQYIFNSSVINPAQAGARGENQAGILGRYQWVGIDGAPSTHTAFANLSLPHNLGIAVGIYQDNVGPVKDLTFQTDIAYSARLAEEWFLSAGLRMVTSSMSIDLTNLENIIDSGDPMFNRDLSSGFRFNIGTGLLAFTNRHFFGISMPRMLNLVNKDSHSVSHHLFIYGGSTFDITREITISPSALFKNSELAPAQIDINAIAGYDNMIDFGPMIRSNMAKGWVDAIGFLAGYHLNENWYFGYMYEYPTNNMRVATRQTHEISLRYQWESAKHGRYRRPSFFLNDRRARR